MKNKSLTIGAIVSVIFFLPTLAQAHVGHGATHGFFNGAAHPLHGLDHLLTMVAVGLWAVLIGGRALWVVPSAFVGVMVMGGVLGIGGIAVPFVETGVLVSMLALGLLIAASITRMPLAVSAAVVGLFALFHGHAHGAEMPESSSRILYCVGFVLSTAFLHTCGIGLGIWLKKIAEQKVLRLAGSAIALVGICLWLM